MTASIAVKKHVGGLVHALNEIAVGEKTLMRRNKRSHIGKIDYESSMQSCDSKSDGPMRRTAMNIEPTHHHSRYSQEIGRHHHTVLSPQASEITRCDTLSPTSKTIPQSPSSSTSSSSPTMFGKFLPPILTQHQSDGGLSAIPQSTLYDNLTPVVKALERLDAELLLDLERAQEGQGPIVRKGVYCRPIDDQIRPSIGPVHPNSLESCVRYLHISEVPDQYSIGIFVFPPYAKIPLHDHPNMCVLSRILYGDLHRLSLDLARDDEAVSFLEDASHHNGSNRQDGNTSTGWFRGSWFSRMNSLRNKLPKGSKAAFKNGVDHLQAPSVTMLYPYEGNLHEFVAGPHGAAVLDVLLPPYDNVQNRDCTFYNIQDVSSSNYNGDIKKNKEPCFIVPTGQPENFHCISGKYRDLGENAEDDDHDYDDEGGGDDHDGLGDEKVDDDDDADMEHL